MNSVAMHALSIVPAMTVYIVGIVFSATTLRRMGTPALLTLLGCSLLLLLSLCNILATAIQIRTELLDLDTEQRVLLLTVQRAVNSLAYPIGFGLVLAAALGPRRYGS